MNIDAHLFVITGAGRGLGAAMAQHLAERGARLALVDRDPDGINGLAESLPGDHLALTADVADEPSVIDAFDRICDRLGIPDGLVNNAGITRDGLLVKVSEDGSLKPMDLADWQAVIDVNLTGVFLCGREAASRMIEADRPGVIINISSISKAGNFGQSNYAAAKAGVAAMTVTWAKELARHRIRVNSISPGFMATEMVAAMPEKAQEKVRAQIPLRRLGEPRDIAQAVAFLIENDYASGRDFEIDGGLRL